MAKNGGEQAPKKLELRSVFLTQEQIDAIDELAQKSESSRARFCYKAIIEKLRRIAPEAAQT